MAGRAPETIFSLLGVGVLVGAIMAVDDRLRFRVWRTVEQGIAFSAGSENSVLVAFLTVSALLFVLMLRN